MNDEQMHQDARPIATRMSQEIANEANKRPPEEIAAFAGLVSSLVVQNLVVSIIMAQHAPGSEGGRNMLNIFYHQMLKDAHERWSKPDLKTFRERH